MTERRLYADDVYEVRYYLVEQQKALALMLERMPISVCNDGVAVMGTDAPDIIDFVTASLTESLKALEHLEARLLPMPNHVTGVGFRTPA